LNSDVPTRQPIETPKIPPAVSQPGSSSGRRTTHGIDSSPQTGAGAEVVDGAAVVVVAPVVVVVAAVVVVVLAAVVLVVVGAVVVVGVGADVTAQ
jgi:hypothetical protein